MERMMVLSFRLEHHLAHCSDKNCQMEIRLVIQMVNPKAKHSVHCWAIHLVNWKASKKEMMKVVHSVRHLELNLAKQRD